MGWIAEHMADGGQVKGLIGAYDANDRLACHDYRPSAPTPRLAEPLSVACNVLPLGVRWLSVTVPSRLVRTAGTEPSGTAISPGFPSRARPALCARMTRIRSAVRRHVRQLMCRVDALEADVLPLTLPAGEVIKVNGIASHGTCGVRFVYFGRGVPSCETRPSSPSTK
jgi:hypothetical protein